MESLERVFVALGSNIEPRGKRLAEARAMLKRISLGGWKESSIYETSPVGPQDQGPFLNQVVTFWYGKGPEKLLNYLKGAELFLGRHPRGHWEKREIDMDLIYYGESICSGKQGGPTVPHPLATGRGFVMVPLADIKQNNSSKDELVNRAWYLNELSKAFVKHVNQYEYIKDNHPELFNKSGQLV